MKLTAQWYQDVLSGLSPLKVTENNIKDYLQILNTKEKSMLHKFIKSNNSHNCLSEEESRKNINQLVEDHIKLFGPAKYAKNHAPIRKVLGKSEIINAVNACLDGWFTEGKYNKAFEKFMANYLSTKYFLTCNSGSSANLLALSALCSEELGIRRLKKRR